MHVRELPAMKKFDLNIDQMLENWDTDIAK